MTRQSGRAPARATHRHQRRGATEACTDPAAHLRPIIDATGGRVLASASTVEAEVRASLKERRSTSLRLMASASASPNGPTQAGIQQWLRSIVRASKYPRRIKALRDAASGRA